MQRLVRTRLHHPPLSLPIYGESRGQFEALNTRPGLGDPASAFFIA